MTTSTNAVLAGAIAAAAEDLKRAIRLTAFRRARLEQLLIDAGQISAGHLTAVVATMPNNRMAAANAEAEQER